MGAIRPCTPSPPYAQRSSKARVQLIPQRGWWRNRARWAPLLVASFGARTGRAQRGLDYPAKGLGPIAPPNGPPLAGQWGNLAEQWGNPGGATGRWAAPRGRTRRARAPVPACRAGWRAGAALGGYAQFVVAFCIAGAEAQNSGQGAAKPHHPA